MSAITENAHVSARNAHCRAVGSAQVLWERAAAPRFTQNEPWHSGNESSCSDALRVNNVLPWISTPPASKSMDHGRSSSLQPRSSSERVQNEQKRNIIRFRAKEERESPDLSRVRQAIGRRFPYELLPALKERRAVTDETCRTRDLDIYELSQVR